MHLEVELAVPAVVGQSVSCVGTRRLDGHQILREHHTSLQLSCTFIGAGEVNSSAVLPEGSPVVYEVSAL